MKKPASMMLVTPADGEEFASKLGALFGPLEADVSEASILTEGPLFNGRAEVHPVRPGLRLFVMDMDARRDVHLSIRPASSGLLVSLVLDGRSGYTVRGAAGHHDQWQFLPGRNIIGTFKTEESRWNIIGGDSHRLVELQIASGSALRLFSQYRELAGYGGAAPSLLTGHDGFPTHIQHELSSELRIIGHQVLNCRLQGPARRLFMESKALEILAYQLDMLSSPKLREPTGRSKDERCRLEEARRIIETELVDPPSLMTLARRVGLNDFKLKRGFRELYQTTVFGYVRSLRMEKARLMLETGEMNVSEVALATGYSCFGHFSEAFRKHFGLTPREFKNRRRS